MEMLKNAYSEARRLLSEHRQSLDKIAAFLIEKETITGKEFMEIFHEAEGIDPETEKKQGERVTVKEAEPQIEQKSEAAIDSNMESNEAVKEETEE